MRILIAALLFLFLLGGLLSAKEYVRSGKVHRAFLKQTGYPHGRPGWVVDHVFPLCAGGQDVVTNMQWSTVADAKVKDKSEWQLCRRIRQLVAQFEKDWIPTP